MKSTIVILCFFCASCTMLSDRLGIENEKTTLSVINWNVQTFFDSKEDGTEYYDFKGSNSAWSEELYIKRLKTLSNFIMLTKADVYVFQEIENSAILQDLANELVGLRATKKGYGYSCFSKQKEDALGIAIFSRYPLENIRVHQVDYDVALGLSMFNNSSDILDGTKLEQPSMRSILEAQVVVSPHKTLTIYASHWKSKYGGEKETEVWRNTQERLLADLLILENNPFIATGDFNRTLDEFIKMENKNDSADERVVMQGSGESINLISPWITFDEKTTAKGSYYYEGEWEKIDHFFYNDSLTVLDFQTITNTITVGDLETPMRFNLYTGNGSSDHLPLSLEIKL